MKIQEFDFSINVLQALLWQYNEAKGLQRLLEQKQDWYNEKYTKFWNDWYTDVFNLETANEFGLAVWSIILNLPLFIGPPPDPPSKLIWGFEDTHKNFDHGNFSNAGGGTISLSLEEKRLILRLRYFQLVSRGAVPETNAFLKLLFKDYGPIYILDGLDMSIVAVFLFPVPRRLQIILEYYDLIPRPSGVKLRYRYNPSRAFGFGPYKKNFDNGNFWKEV